jgi:hypothetical protein
MNDEFEKLKKEKEKQSEHQATNEMQSDTSFQSLNQQQSFSLIQSRMHQSDDQKILK